MRLIILLSLFLGFASTGFAEELHLVVNGKAVHFGDGDYNEENWGLGVEYTFTPRNDWIKFVSAGFFKDSSYNTSKHVGGGIKRRYRLDNDEDGWFVDLGATAFLMTRKDYKDNNPFFGALPFMTVGNGPVALNVTYIPSVSPKHEALVYFQAVIRLATFD